MKVIFLGTNGWYDTRTGDTICILLQTTNAHIVLDAGNGLYKLDRYIKDKKPVYLFLSHFHLDHIFGLHSLEKFNFPSGLKIIVPFGTKKIFQNIIRQPYTMPLRDIKYPVDLSEVAAGSFPFLVETRKLFHVTDCWGYRLKVEGKIIAYGPDTGECPGLYQLAENADLFIAECAYRPGQKSSVWPHLNPETAARVARKAKVKKLILTHFDAHFYQTKKARMLAQKVARKIFSNTFASYDGLTINL